MSGLLHGLHIFSELKVFVLSNDGWSWVLAWAQLGVLCIRCIPLSEKSLIQLDAVKAVLGGTVEVICSNIDDINVEPSPVVSFHQQGLVGMDRLGSILIAKHSLITLLCSFDSEAGAELREIIDFRICSTELRHRRLGGLTTARLHVGWHPETGVIQPGKRRNPTRPLGAFLEPSVKLKEWRFAADDSGCWDPNETAPTPFHWPPQSSSPWVRTSSVYFKERLVEQPMTNKEKAQLLDLREDWGAMIVNDVWKWNNSESPPLRFMVEFVLSALPWLSDRVSTMKPVNKEKNIEEVIDWSRTKDPSLFLNSDLEDSRTALECWIYFGWHWDPIDSVDISVATKADDAEVDLSLWNVGGDGPGMENARGIIRNLLRDRWIRRMTIEAAKWYNSNQDVSDVEQARNREAIIDCITRCSHSTWWEWSDGSRLNFWRWPEVWSREARDGAPGFHTSTLTPKYNFTKGPAKDDWTKEKINEKLRILIQRRYIVPGMVIRVMPYFDVKKGLNDHTSRLEWI